MDDATGAQLAEVMVFFGQPFYPLPELVARMGREVAGQADLEVAHVQADWLLLHTLRTLVAHAPEADRTQVHALITLFILQPKWYS